MSDWSYKGKVLNETLGFMWDDICEIVKGMYGALLMVFCAVTFVSILWCCCMVAVQIKHGNYENWHWWVWIPLYYLISVVFCFIIAWIRDCHRRAKTRLR